MKVDFVLCYEYWKRELFALLLIKKELEKRGYKVKLLNIQPNINEFLEPFFYEPEVVVFPWVYSNRELKRARFFKGNVQKIVNMQCEQLLSKRVLENGFFRIRENAVNAYHVSWGENSYCRYKEYGIEEDHIWNIGNVNLEINKKEYDTFFCSRDELAKRYHLDPQKKWFLFSSNFKFTNMKIQELINLELRSSKIFLLRNEMSKTKQVVLQWMVKYLENNDDIEIIYRSHPIEAKDPYLEYMAQKYTNFKYISDMSINQWVRVCQRCATWNSTAILDSVYLNIPSVFLMPYEMPKVLKGDLDYLCKSIANYEEFEKFLKYEERGNKEEKLQFEKYILGDKNNTIEMLVEKLVQLYESKSEYIFQDAVLQNEEWKLLSLKRKWEVVLLWFSKYTKFIGTITKNSVYKEAYNTRKIEKMLYKKLKEN